MSDVQKVLHVTFDMAIGGTQQVIRQLIENIDNKAIDSEVVCIDNSIGEFGEILHKKGIAIHLLNRQPGFDWKVIVGIRSLIKSRSIDIIHCHQYTPYLYGVLAAIMTNTKVIFTEHGRFYPDYSSWKRKLLNPILSLFTSNITAISKATKNALVKYDNFNTNEIQIIYNGITDKSEILVNEIGLRKQFQIPENSFIFGTVSRLQPIKNQAMMIQAFKQLNDLYSNTHLLIVGDGEIRSELEELVEELRISGQVTFTGFQNDPYCFHKIIDVFLLTSFSEGTSMTLLETMSFSTPCIVTNVGGNPELIDHGASGFIIESGNVKELVSKSMHLLKEEKQRKKNG